jgi:hypothetical protein
MPQQKVKSVNDHTENLWVATDKWGESKEPRLSGVLWSIIGSIQA